MRKKIVLLDLSVAHVQRVRLGQDKKRPSPPAQAQCKLAGGKTLTIDYSSPRPKGRKIFGDLVPYGEVWRTGANEATTFVTDCEPERGRQRCAGGKLYDFHCPGCRQVDPDHQQENRRVGDSLQVRSR